MNGLTTRKQIAPCHGYRWRGAIKTLWFISLKQSQLSWVALNAGCRINVLPSLTLLLCYHVQRSQQFLLWKQTAETHQNHLLSYDQFKWLLIFSYCLPVGCFLVRHHLVFFWKPPSVSFEIEMPDYYFLGWTA